MTNVHRCTHPGCDRPSAGVAILPSPWEDAASSSAVALCDEHLRDYGGTPVR